MALAMSLFAFDSSVSRSLLWWVPWAPGGCSLSCWEPGCESCGRGLVFLGRFLVGSTHRTLADRPRQSEKVMG